jgi:hypothetical protein
MKTHFKKLKNPNYIGSWDLADKNGIVSDLVVKITGVKKEMVFDGKGGQDECVVIQLENYKPFIANSTNLKTIASIYGNYIEDWEGQAIKLTVKRIKAFGEFHDALRVVKEKIENNKPEFTPNSPTWEDAKTAIKNGAITLDQLLTKYTISDENRKAIQN